MQENLQLNFDYFNQKMKSSDDHFPITLNTTFDKWYKSQLEKKIVNFALIDRLYFIEGSCELKYYKECKSLQFFSFDLKKQFQKQNILTNFSKSVLKNKQYDIDYIVIFDVHFKEVKKFIKAGWSTNCFNKVTHDYMYQSIYMKNDGYLFDNLPWKCKCYENNENFEEEEIENYDLDDENDVYGPNKIVNKNQNDYFQDFLTLNNEDVILLQLFFMTFFLLFCILKYFDFA